MIFNNATHDNTNNDNNNDSNNTNTNTNTTTTNNNDDDNNDDNNDNNKRPFYRIKAMYQKRPVPKSGRFLESLGWWDPMKDLRSFATFCRQFPMNIYDRDLQHFCDDPVCRDPVWKLSN